MSTSHTCPRCNTILPEDTPEGLCAACVLSTCSSESDVELSPPSVSEVAAAFPELEVIAHLRSGGMGHVFKVLHRATGRTEALKVLSHDDLAVADSDYLRLFEHEARAQAALNHSHIVTIFDSGRSGDGDFSFIRMEFMEGGDLGHRLRDRTFTPRDALAQMPALCDALHHAHERGIIHRDLKPANILLAADGRAKLADFGLARHAHAAGSTILGTGHQAGTPGFAAPEQQINPRHADARSDIYSLGRVLRYIAEVADPIGTPLPPAVADIASKATEDDPDRRYQTALELKAVFENLRSHSASSDKAKLPLERASNLCPDPTKIVIDYDDDWITINGTGFGPCPLLSELTQILGTPDPKIDPIKRYDAEKEEVLRMGYLWPDLGIGAVSTDSFFPAGEFSLPINRSVWPDDPEPVDPQRAARIQQLQVLVGEAGHKPFQGTLRICGLEFRKGITAEQLVQMKSGIPLEISGRNPLVVSPHASSGLHRTAANPLPEGTLHLLDDGRCIEMNSEILDACSISVEGDGQKGWHKRPIKVVRLNFEDYRHPCESLLKLPLRHNEKIINSVHTGVTCVSRMSITNTSRVDAMVTNQRLIIDSTGWDAPTEIELSSSPDIEYKGLIKLPRVDAAIRGLTWILVSAGGAWGLWKYAEIATAGSSNTIMGHVYRYGLLGIALLLFCTAVIGLVRLLVTLRQDYRPACFGFCLRTSENSEPSLFRHGSPIRRTILGYNTMASFAYRLRCVVARFSRSNSGTAGKSSSRPTESAPSLANQHSISPSMLVDCVACGKAISVEARECPECGQCYDRPPSGVSPLSKTSLGLKVRVRSALQPGELAVFATRRHWFAFALWLVFAFVALIISVIVGWNPVVLPALCLLPAAIKVFGSEYAVTDRRIIIREGILKSDDSDRPIHKLANVQVKAGFLERIFGTGSVVLVGSGGPPETLKHIADPSGFRDAANLMISRSGHAP